MFGAVGELGILSVGIGSDRPFLRIGSKLVRTEILEKAVRSNLPDHVEAKREDYTVPYGDSSKTFLGMKIELPKEISSIDEIYGAQFLMMNKLLEDSVFARSFDALPQSTKLMFGKVTGSPVLLNILKMPNEKAPGFASWVVKATAFRTGWKEDRIRFRTMRRKYLLYQ
jgi:hypothetical protein